eukprot:gene10768-12543_t
MPDEKVYPDWAIAYIQRQKEAASMAAGTIPSGTSTQVSRTSDSGAKEGIFRIVPQRLQTTPTISPQNDPIADVCNYFSTPKACFTIICEEDENRLLASNFLTMFGSVVVDHFKNTLSKTLSIEVFSKTDEVLVLLHSYLPNGQLLFTSTQFAKHIKSSSLAQEKS